MASVARIMGLIAVLLCPYCAPHAGEIYKSVDAAGHVVYSDRAPAPGARKSVVRVDRPNAEEVARNAKEQEILKVEDQQRKRQQAVDDARSAQKAREDHNRQVQCDNARNRYYALRESRRIYRRDAEGNRVFYDDSEADARREEARQAMAGACDS